MDKYIILSLNHSTKDEAVFWRDNNAGYTNIPWAAGIYTEEEVRSNPAYYNDGYNTIAIPLDNQHINNSGLKFSLNLKELKSYIQKHKHKG